MNERCKQRVYDQSGWHSWQCSRNAWKDGFCKQHHPDTVAERRRRNDELLEAKRKASAWYKLKQANKRIAELEAEIAVLKGANQ